jgi:demethylmenaquinone methyltransferase / 2-methoxy-6-polyprenyl-1,4-benzoquinol methylase
MPAQRGADVTTGRLEARQVRAMFDRISGVYDLLNTVMTAGLHHRWRARAVDLARVGPGSRVLDVATGTGDLAIELARRVSPGGEVIGSDFSEGMLARARIKGAKAFHGVPRDYSSASQNGPLDLGPSHPNPTSHPNPSSLQPASLSFEWGDALELPYPDDTFDAATVGFGARNFSDLAQGLKEMARVVRPGGRVVVLEMTTPTRAPLSLFYRLWFDRMVPIIGRLAGSLASLSTPSSPPSQTTIAPPQTTIAQAYTYLPNSVERFHSPEALAAEMERAGCSDIGYVLMAGGIIAVHGATVPEDGTP